MAADPTLVSAAFKLAQSRAGADVPNLKPLYESQKDISKQYLGMITGALDEIKKENEVARIGKSNQMKGFNKVAQGAYDKLYSQQETMPDKVVNAMRDEINRLQDEFDAVNTYGENDTQENETARTRITAQLKRITNQAINARKNFIKIGDIAKTNNWNEELIDENNITPMQSVLDLKNMDRNDNITVAFIDGELTFSTKNYYSAGDDIWGDAMSFTAQQMFDALPEFNNAIPTALLALHNSAGDKGAQDVKDGLPNAYDKPDTLGASKDAILGNITDEKSYQTASTIQMFSRHPSFKDALLDRVDIPLNIIENMFFDDNGERVAIGQVFLELDRAGATDAKGNPIGDGVINAEDLSGLSGEALESFKANHAAMIDAIINIHNPAFNFANSKSLLGDYYAGLEKNKYTQEYEANDPNKAVSGVGFKFNVNQGYTMTMGDGTEKWVSGQLVVTMQNFINNPREGQVQRGYDGNIYSYKDGKFYMGESVVTQSQISKNLGMWQYGYNPKDTYEPELLPPIVEGTEEAGAIPSAPSRGLLSTTFDTEEGRSKIIGELEVLYEPFGDFKFEVDLGILLITSPDGKESIRVDMGRSFRGSGKAGKKIQAFIKKHAKQTEEEK